jgi:hypothetical protein
MAKGYYKHISRRSWWDGSHTALCGATATSDEAAASVASWFDPWCSACVAVRDARRRGKK